MASGKSSGVTIGDQMSFEQQEAEQVAAENERKAGHTSTLPAGVSQVKHIFRNAPGHLSETRENKQLILSVSNDPNCYIGTDSKGKKWYAKTLDDKSQVWVSVYNSVICDAGLNPFPRQFDSESGLNNNPKRNGSWRKKK